jgi:hypothetical protein
MGDVEFVSELLIGVLHGPQGGGERIIDEYYMQYEDYEDEFPQQRRVQKLFDETLTTIEQLFIQIKETRWSNKTDFYTLFVGLASLLRKNELPKANMAKVKKALVNFEKEIDRRIGNQEVEVSSDAVDYVRAVEKGANDKKRRADRQTALMNIVRGFFKPRKKK